MRITTIPYSFSLAAGPGTRAYLIAGPIPIPYKIIGLYALAEPTPSQLVYIQLYKYGSNQNPSAGTVPSGATIFDEWISGVPVRLGRIPTDMDLDIPIDGLSFLLCFAQNDSAAQQQCEVEVKVALP